MPPGPVPGRAETTGAAEGGAGPGPSLAAALLGPRAPADLQRGDVCRLVSGRGRGTGRSRCTSNCGVAAEPQSPEPACQQEDVSLVRERDDAFRPWTTSDNQPQCVVA